MSINIDEIKISDYDYDLPDNRIAKHPLSKRDESKLLIYKNKGITEDIFMNIEKYIPKGSAIILNNTKVVRARLKFKKITGTEIEIFLLEPMFPTDYTQSFCNHERVTWKCLVGNLKRWKGEVLELGIEGTKATLYATKVNILTEGVEVEFSWNDQNLSFAQIIEICGNVPIPPYLNRKSDDIDKDRYQTVYAQPEGSVAAPTAGLHFTEYVFDSLSLKSIKKHYLTLHVGAGTFKPVKAESISEHEMHTEHFFVEKSLIQNIVNTEGKIFVVGTTTLRTLESLYWLGVKAFLGKLEAPFFVSQWEPYNLAPLSVKDAFKSLLGYMQTNNLNVVSASTQIMIVPGYNVMTADALITNFHQPRSTLLLLVSAFIGDDWKSIYSYAMENNFRFLSYGDSNLLFRKEC